jgi:hypothetical protein
VQSFAAGETAPNLAGNLVIADSVVAAVNEGTVFVVNPADGSTYYYMEGMNAPSSNYRVYGSNPRAVTVVDRSLKEVEPGVYAGRVKIPVAGKYDVAFTLDSPKLLHCFSVQAKVNPLIAQSLDPLTVEFDERSRSVTAGGRLGLRFKLIDPATRLAKAGIKGVSVLYFLAPGRGRTEVAVKEIGGGVYEAEMQLAQSGAYYVYVAVPSMKLGYGNLPFFTLRAMPPHAAAVKSDAI